MVSLRSNVQVEALKLEQLFLQGRVREELHKLIDSDPVVKELYQMRGEVPVSYTHLTLPTTPYV